MTTLTQLQEVAIAEASRVGCRLRDSLIIAGFHGDALEEAMHDPQVLSIAEAARAEASMKLRKSLVAAAQKGNVSAARVLSIHHRDKEQEPDALPVSPLTREQQRAQDREIMLSMQRAFARQRALLELDPNE